MPGTTALALAQSSQGHAHLLAWSSSRFLTVKIESFAAAVLTRGFRLCASASVKHRETILL